eukprot:SAG11_NODE_3397_length_2471_cov_2.713744_4_plen_48_part_00
MALGLSPMAVVADQDYSGPLLITLLYVSPPFSTGALAIAYVHCQLAF